MDASIILTYRCPMRCRMCSIWQYPTRVEEEFKPELLEKLPKLSSINVTGGEPFEREDIEEIVAILVRKSKRVVFSTNGWYTERIVALAQKYPQLGFRISLEGLEEKNDQLRGVEGGFQQGMKTLRALKNLGCKDLGFGITLSGTNSEDMLALYRLSQELQVEFATAASHNSFYFHKHDNVISDKESVAKALEQLAEKMLSENAPKSWARAYFNTALAAYVRGEKRPLPCYAGTTHFFLDPWGHVLPCNGMSQALSMGNLSEVDSFEALWKSPRAQEVRRKVKACRRNCWMIGMASPSMKRHLIQVAWWVVIERLKRRLK